MSGPRLEIKRTLGKGGFGTVYHAILYGEDGFAKEVALKVLNPAGAATPEIASRLRDEARILGQLRHRAIVGVQQLTQHDGRPAVIMEYVEGSDLSDLAERATIPPRVALEIVAEVADALHAASTACGLDGHPLNLVHRDIKPANIRLTVQGEVKVLDFGVARAEFTGREAQTTSLAFGSLGYMAPERISMAQDTPASDVYSLGVVLHDLLTTFPFGPTNGNRRSHEQGKLVEAKEALDAVTDAGTAQLVLAALSFDASDRPTAREMERRARALADAASGPSLRTWARDVVALQVHGVADPAPPPLPLPPRWTRRRLALLVAFAWVGLGALALGVVLLVPTARLTLAVPPGAQATLDGAPWDGSPRAAKAGAHALHLERGCAASDHEIRVVPWWRSPAPGEIAPRRGPTPLDDLPFPSPKSVSLLLHLKGLPASATLDPMALAVGGQAAQPLVTSPGRSPQDLIARFDAPGCGSTPLTVSVTATDGDRRYTAIAKGAVSVAPETESSAELTVGGPWTDPTNAQCAGSFSGHPTGPAWMATAQGVSMAMVGLSAGSLMMGSPDGEGGDEEHPCHPVTLSAFSLGKSEITQAQWREIVRLAKAAGIPDAAGLKAAPSHFKGDERPVEGVSWCDAVHFANAVSALQGLEPAYTVEADCAKGGAVAWRHEASGYRLPTEAEWEYAARAGTATDYFTGDDPAALCGVANIADRSAKGKNPSWNVASCDDGAVETSAVCSYNESPWGLCDLTGNVWEWVWDSYVAPYDPSAGSDPSGPAQTGFRVLRGGSCNDSPDLARSAYRGGLDPALTVVLVGLRLALPGH